MNVQVKRLRADLLENAEFGKESVDEGIGRTLLTGTEADRRARERFVGRLTDAGLAVRIDGLGNIAGRWIPESADPDRAPVAAGSHLDSVPHGGIFDGPLGTYGALEAVRAIKDGSTTPDRPIDVVCWTEEEGARFGTGLLGSAVATGKRKLETARRMTDNDGTTVEEALDAVGFVGTDTIDPSSWESWYELHIEQGTDLISSAVPVGVVERIVGISNCRIVCDGDANHAGTTPLETRRDALVAAADFIRRNDRRARQTAKPLDETAVNTVGKADVSPNATNVVPGHVRMRIDVRGETMGTVNELVREAELCADEVSEKHAADVSFEQYRLTEPTEMTSGCVDTAVGAAKAGDVGFKRMPSAAMHDTANIAEVTDVGMLFAPSVDGVSHNPTEWTRWEDCAAATEVLAETLARAAVD